MKMIRPVDVTDANLVSSTLAEPSGADPAAYNAATRYAVGDQCRLASTHLIYQSLQDSGTAPNTGHSPDTSPTWWGEVCAVNKWAMFDASTSSASTGASPLTVVFTPGIIDALVLIGMIGNQVEVTISDGLGGPTVYHRTEDLQIPVVNDWWSYWFEPFRQRGMVVLTDLPPYLNSRVTVSFTGDADVACAVCIPGRSYNLGMTLNGADAGIHDYSRKVTDDATGLITLQKRKYAKTLRANVRVDSVLFDEISAQLEAVRATPVMWIADDTGRYQPMSVYGFYKDFTLTYNAADAGVYALTIEGMA